MISYLLILQACSFIMWRHAHSYLSSAITGAGASGTRVCVAVYSAVCVCVDDVRVMGDGGDLPFSISSPHPP